MSLAERMAADRGELPRTPDVTDKQLLCSRRSTTCPMCGSWKQRNTPVCKSCYDQLPKPIQRMLKYLIGSGYAEGIEAARRYLKISTLTILKGGI